MTLNRFFNITIVLLLVVPIHAQQYHDAALEEIVGSVKEIVYIKSDFETICYDRNGKETKAFESKENRQYDADGYLVFYEFDSKGMHCTAHVSYDEHHRLKQHKSIADGGCIIHELVYNKEGYVSQSTVTIEAIDEKRKYKFTYTYLTYDDIGNWLSRIRKGHRSVEYENRIIRYY